MENRSQLIKLKKKILPILKKHKATRAGIFGSFARGDFTKKSDVDILVELDKSLDLFDVIKVKIDLENALRKKVDLVEYNVIRPELRETILKQEVSIL